MNTCDYPTFLPENLEPGDILLFHGKGALSDAIRLFDDSCVNHAALYVGGPEKILFEAVGDGVLENPLQNSPSLGHSPWALVLRHKNRPENMQPVFDVAKKYKGNPYAVGQLLLVGFLCLTRKLPLGKKDDILLRQILDTAGALFVQAIDDDKKEPLICSEFVYRCYDEAQVDSIDAYTIDALSNTALREKKEHWSRAHKAVEKIAEKPLEDIEKDFENAIADFVNTTPKRKRTFLEKVFLVAKPILIKLFGEKHMRDYEKDLNKILGEYNNGISDFVTPGDLERSASLEILGKLQTVDILKSAKEIA